MWHRLAILIVGYGFIVMTYAGTWTIAVVTSRYVEHDRVERLEKADVQAVLGVMAVWTVVWVVIAITSVARGAWSFN